MKKAVHRCLLAGFFVASCQPHPAQVSIGIAVTEGMHPAVELAAEEINAEGGVRGIPLRLKGLDWKVLERFESDESMRLGEHLASQQDLVAVVGHMNSMETLSAAPFYNQSEIPQIVPTATSSAITAIGDWTYRICPSDAIQGPALAEHAFLDWDKRRLAMFYANDDYGRELAFRLQERFMELGGELVSSVPTRTRLEVQDEESIRDTLKRLGEAGFGGREDVFVLIQFVTSGAAPLTLRAIEAAGFETDILGGDTLGAYSLGSELPSIKNRLRYSVFYLPLPEYPRSMRFHRKYEARHGRSPDYLHAFAYEAVYLLRDAIREGGYSRSGVKAYLDRLIREHTPIDGLATTYTLGSDHDARRGFHVVETRGGRHVPIKYIGPEVD